jgi:hypothetical protein
VTYAIRREEKSDTTRANRVNVSSIPADYVAALEAEWAALSASPVPFNVVIDLESPKEVTRHASYARAWGLSRENDKVEVRKLPAKTGDTENTLRLSMEKHDPNKPKLGRKPNGEKANAGKAEKAAA